jgi:uncharacterized protein YkwD
MVTRRPITGMIERVRPLLVLVSVLTLAAVTYAAWPRDSQTHSDPCGATEAKPAEIGLAAAGRTTLCLVNRERTGRGLQPLRENGLLTAASLEHSTDMVRGHYFEHTSADGRSVGDRLRAVGYSRGFSASAGENLAFGVGAKSTPASIVRAWMHSPPHRADILRGAFTEIGIGIVLGVPGGKTDGATYTTDFGGVVDPTLPQG